jgi:hypothetical protein
MAWCRPQEAERSSAEPAKTRALSKTFSLGCVHIHPSRSYLDKVCDKVCDKGRGKKNIDELRYSLKMSKLQVSQLETRYLIPKGS